MDQKPPFGSLQSYIASAAETLRTVSEVEFSEVRIASAQHLCSSQPSPTATIA
jgi:hypothetical protein